jgi:hypothetical protein
MACTFNPRPHFIVAFSSTTTNLKFSDIIYEHQTFFDFENWEENGENYNCESICYFLASIIEYLTVYTDFSLEKDNIMAILDKHCSNPDDEDDHVETTYQQIGGIIAEYLDFYKDDFIATM